MQEKGKQSELAKDDRSTGMKIEQTVPQQANQEERKHTPFDAVETARNDVLKTNATTTNEHRPVKGNRQTSI